MNNHARSSIFSMYYTTLIHLFNIQTAYCQNNLDDSVTERLIMIAVEALWYLLKLGTGQYLLGCWNWCILNFQCQKSLCPILWENKQKLVSYHISAEIEKSSSSMIILAEKSMCPIAFCTGSNPPMNIDQSLTNLQVVTSMENAIRTTQNGSNRAVRTHAKLLLKERRYIAHQQLKVLAIKYLTCKSFLLTN